VFSESVCLWTEAGRNGQEKEDAMFTLLGEVPLITINLGNVHLALYLSQLMYLLVAALVGFVAEFIVGWRLPFGIIGAIIAALVGIWIVSNVVILIIPGDPVFFGIPLFKAVVSWPTPVASWQPTARTIPSTAMSRTERQARRPFG
jgi:uncharacterized membrane protein YeaQ/YmgE (transglycosylase-associated protein family)